MDLIGTSRAVLFFDVYEYLRFPDQWNVHLLFGPPPLALDWCPSSQRKTVSRGRTSASARMDGPDGIQKRGDLNYIRGNGVPLASILLSQPSPHVSHISLPKA